MQYVSPLAFLPAKTAATLDQRDLKLAKHKLLAEFELTGATTIQIGKKEVTRNDVLKLFDQLSQSGDLEFHLLVAAHPVLLHFLEHQEIAPSAKFDIPDEKLTDAFIDWISPYFSWAFNKTTIRIFRDIKPEELETLIINPRLMNEADEWNAWSGAETYLHMVITNFIKINDAKFHTPGQVVQYACYNVVWLLCNLPEERFSPFINNYAFELMRMAIREFNSSKRDSAFEILGYARSLRVSETTMQSLKDKEQEMHNIVQGQKKEGGTSTWGVVRIIFLIIFVLSRVATCH